MKTVFAFIFSIFSVICLAQGNGYLGISMKTLQNGGVRISDVLQNGAAETYGMFQNDVILSIDGIKVNSNVELKKIISNKDWGDKISVVYDRNGHTNTKLITLGNRANKVTYEVKRTRINSEFEWSFDNSTWIRMVNGTPLWIKKKNQAGTFDVHTIKKGVDVPQFFSDLDDKLEIIKAINERNKGKKVFPSITVFIKTYSAQCKIMKNNSDAVKLDLSVFPNPSLGDFNFTLKADNPESNIIVWQVIDISGKLVKEGSLNDFNGNARQELNLTEKGAGVYLLKVIHNNQVFTERLIVN